MTKKQFSVCIVSNSYVSSDPRIIKQINTYMNMGMKVFVIGYGSFQEKNSLSYLSIPINSTENSCTLDNPSSSNRSVIQKITRALQNPFVIFKALQWQIEKRQFFILLILGYVYPSIYEKIYWSQIEIINTRKISNGLNCDFFHANDISTLPVALEIANGKPLIFDAHEYSPYELNSNWVDKYLINSYNSYLCTKYIPRATRMTTVCDGIAQMYKRKTKKSSIVIRNVPSYQLLDFKKTDFDNIKLIHHGIAAPERNLEGLIEVVSLLPDNYNLTFMLVGSDNSPYRKKLIHLAKLKAGNRIKFIEPVPYKQLIKTLNDFDMGIYLLKAENNFINHKYALPNKFFEFIMAGLCVAIGPSVEMKRILDDYNCGVASNFFSSHSLAKSIKNLSVEQIDLFKKSSLKAAKQLNAEIEMQKLVAMYNEMNVN